MRRSDRAGAAPVRYVASAGTSCVHMDMPADEWEALCSFPDALARLTRRMTKALGLDDPEKAQWELINVQGETTRD